MSKSIPVSLQDLLSELDFLGQITRGQKPCMIDMTIVDSSSWTGAFKRYYNGESRDMVVKEISHIIEKAINTIMSHTDTDFMVLIINRMAQARIGIETLTITYRDDPKVKSKINVILSNIDIQLIKYRHLIKGYAVSNCLPLNITPDINDTNTTNVTNVTNAKPSEIVEPVIPVVPIEEDKENVKKVIKTKIRSKVPKKDTIPPPPPIEILQPKPVIDN